MQIVIIEPYLTGSHAAWAQGYARHSRLEVEILGMPGRYWKWRMHGGAVTLAREYLERQLEPDIVIASDMLDLTTFLALIRGRRKQPWIYIYFHENQLTYPWSPQDRDIIHKRDKHYGFINYTSILSADGALFNSAFHLKSFLEALPALLNHFPDYRELDTVAEIRGKSHVLPLGLELSDLDGHSSSPAVVTEENSSEAEAAPMLLWNHRWEYDKNPEGFFDLLRRMNHRGLKFRLAVVGENFRNKPEEFQAIQREFERNLVYYGYAEEFGEYARLLWQADILPVTSIQDFFGMSVVEASYCNTYPLLPKRLAYPELIPELWQKYYLYSDEMELENRIAELLANPKRIGQIMAQAPLRDHLARYDWQRMASIYDDFLIDVMG